MTELGLHIRFLLQNCDCVILPGIGAFMAQTLPARFDRNSAVIHPVQRRYWFNPLIRHSDGLLARSIARRRRISYEEATASLAETCAAVAADLERGEPFSVPGVGALLPVGSGVVTFTPGSVPALKPVALRPAQIPEAEAEPAIPARKAPVSSDYYLLRLNKTFVQVAASLLIVLGAAIAVIVPLRPSIDSMQRASLVATVSTVAPVQPRTMDDVVADLREAPQSPSDAPQNHSEASQSPSEASRNSGVAPASSAQESTVVQPAAEARKYYLVVAAAHTQPEIDRFVAQHADTGYDLRVAPGPGIKKVYALESADKEMLQRVMNSKDFINEFGLCWIYTPKKAKK